MRPAELRERLGAGLRDFAWDEWAQMGVLAAPRRRSPWAQDPEALVVFTLEVARDDPRLFDEVLDWLLVNESLLSVRRLRAMCRDADDARLLDATLGWLARSRRRARLQPRGEHETPSTPEPLFRGLTTPVREADPDFLSHGYLRPVLIPTGKAGSPQMRAPVNLAFRLRQLLGVSVRAEVLRHLLTAEAPVTLDVLAGSAAFAKRNVQEALTSLHIAGVVSLLTSEGMQRYAIDPQGWRALLAIDAGELAVHRDWRQSLRGLRLIARWLNRADLDDLSEYLLASQARDLLEEVRGDFEYAGISVGRTPGEGARQDLEALVERALRELGVARSEPAELELALPQRPTVVQVYADATGTYRWRLVEVDGSQIAVSSGSYGNLGDAQLAAAQWNAAVPNFETYVDTAGHHRWRAKTDSGKVLAVSAEAFATESAAERAWQRVARRNPAAR